MQEPRYESTPEAIGEPLREPIAREVLEQIQPDMDVCDVDGFKVGTVARVHYLEPIRLRDSGVTAQPREDVIEVKTGFLGLKHLYVPMSAVKEILGGVFLTPTRQEIERMGWDRKPEYLATTH